LKQRVTAVSYDQPLPHPGALPAGVAARDRQCANGCSWVETDVHAFCRVHTHSHEAMRTASVAASSRTSLRRIGFSHDEQDEENAPDNEVKQGAFGTCKYDEPKTTALRSRRKPTAVV